jgi:hypothetical protein
LIPAAEIDRAVAFQEMWGGIALPPAPAYEGGPRVSEADVLEGSAADGWHLPAGDCRVSMAYGFVIGPGGEFGIDADHWIPLHAGMQGWVEALALAHHARRWAQTVTRIKGDAVEEVDLDGTADLVTGEAGGAAALRVMPDDLRPRPAACRY